MSQVMAAAREGDTGRWRERLLSARPAAPASGAVSSLREDLANHRPRRAPGHLRDHPRTQAPRPPAGPHQRLGDGVCAGVQL